MTMSCTRNHEMFQVPAIRLCDFCQKTGGVSRPSAGLRCGRCDYDDYKAWKTSYVIEEALRPGAADLFHFG